ncbi:hypothetical protein [Curtobacterium sp. MCSS17_016]|uniref:hypothetical protein n=1 Tax=Curtobacterium sp. MCSS17_016 TaxID=2175644 RepID=UPI000DAAB21E|nr:hypothetical protein [Curtobacterium sp. MCSS17_016]WIE81380.1 hypothetical protein DEJ19_019285 [Curtobacterium sp. MCSS17_016]
MPTTTFQKTITVEALPLADATDQEVTEFLEGTGWTLFRGGTDTVVLHEVGKEPASSTRSMSSGSRSRLVKVDGVLRPRLILDVSWEREFGGQ